MNKRERESEFKVKRAEIFIAECLCVRNEANAKTSETARKRDASRTECCISKSDHYLRVSAVRQKSPARCQTLRISKLPGITYIYTNIQMNKKYTCVCFIADAKANFGTFL